MNRVVTASLIAVLILFAALAGFIYYNKYRSSASSVLKAIPTDAVFVLDGKITTDMISAFANSSFLKNLTELETSDMLQLKLKALQQLLADDADFKNIFEHQGVTISVHATKVDDYDFIYYLNNANQFNTVEINRKIQLLFDSIANETIRIYADVDVHDLAMKNSDRIFTYAVHADILIASFTPFLVEDAIRQLKAGKSISTQSSFKKFQSENNKSDDLSLYINYKNLSKWFSTFCNQEGNIQFDNIENFADWSKLNINMQKNSCLLTGTTTVTDTASFIKLFAGQAPHEIQALDVIPHNMAVLKAFSFSNKASYFDKLFLYNNRFEKVNSNLLPEKLSASLIALIHNEYGMLITEPGSTTYDNNTYVYFNAVNIKETKQKLEKLPTLSGDIKNQAKVKSSAYRNHQIVSLPYNNSIAGIFGNSFDAVSGFYYTDISNFIFIGNNNSALRLLIDAYEDNKLLNKTSGFANLKTDFTLNANYLYYSQVKNSYYLLQSKFNKKWNILLDDNRDEFEKTESYAYSLKTNQSLFETSVYFKTTESTDDDVSVVWSAQLDYPIAIELQLIENKNNLKYIAIQDSANQLYLINNTGTILWKKQLSEKILTPVYSLDVFKNGNRQIVFNTESKLWMLDFDSNLVSNYPIQLPSEATAALSVVDYENTQDFRFYIPCINGTVYGYQTSGKPIPGWNFTNKNDYIIEPLQYYKVKQMDCLVASTYSGKVIALDRNGKSILKINELVNKKVSFAFHPSDDTSAILFSCLDTAGYTVKIDSAGNVTRNRKYEARTLNNYYLIDINKDGKPETVDVFADEIIATDEAQKTILKFKSPEPIDEHIVFSTDQRGNAIISFSNILHDRIYMINIKGKLIKGMPVKGITLPLVNDMNGDRIKKLITCMDSASVTIYDF